MRRGRLQPSLLFSYDSVLLGSYSRSVFPLQTKSVISSRGGERGGGGGGGGGVFGSVTARKSCEAENRALHHPDHTQRFLGCFPSKAITSLSRLILIFGVYFRKMEAVSRACPHPAA